MDADRSDHSYRGMNIQDYHLYFDTLYNYILDQEFVSNSPDRLEDMKANIIVDDSDDENNTTQTASKDFDDVDC